MRTLHHARRAMREALAGIGRAPLLTAVAASTVAAALLLCGMTAGVWSRGERVLEQVGTDAQLTIALDPDVSPARIAALRADLEARPEVASVRFLTMAEDRARNRALLDPSLLEGLTQDDIPANPCFDVQLRARRRSAGELEALRAWAHAMEGIDGVYAVYFSAERYRMLLALLRTVRSVGLVMGLLIVVTAVFFVFAVTDLVLLVRREEIEVMRLVGATDAFVRAPFVVEGVVVGTFGALLAVVVAHVIDASIERHVALAHGWAVAWGIFPPGVTVAFLVGGLVLGALGSAIAVRRRLRRAP